MFYSAILSTIIPVHSSMYTIWFFVIFASSKWWLAIWHHQHLQATYHFWNGTRNRNEYIMIWVCTIDLKICLKTLSILATVEPADVFETAELMVLWFWVTLRESKCSCSCRILPRWKFCLSNWGLYGMKSIISAIRKICKGHS